VSRISARSVAAMTTTLVEGSNPSMSESNWLSVCSLVVRAEPAWSASAADGIDLVNEDNGGSALAGLGKEIAHSCRPNSHGHLNKTGAAEGEERHPGLASDRSGQKGLAVPGGPTMSTPLGPTAPALAERAGCFKKSTTSMTSALEP
jgi:hypothetical protein